MNAKVFFLLLYARRIKLLTTTSFFVLEQQYIFFENLKLSRMLFVTIVSETPGYLITEAGLVIRNVSSQHSGQYICRARVSHTGQMEERKISLKVNIYREVSFRKLVTNKSYLFLIPENLLHIIF